MFSKNQLFGAPDHSDIADCINLRATLDETCTNNVAIFFLFLYILTWYNPHSSTAFEQDEL